MGLRFLSKYSGFKTPGVRRREEPLADGTRRVVEGGFMCEFEHGGLTAAEREMARTMFTWKGLPTAQDGSPLDPVRDLHRVGVFDTDWAPAHLRKRVEEELLARQGQDFVLVEVPQVGPPVANWVKLTSVQGQRTVDKCAEKALALIEELGLDVDRVVAFERQQNRKESAAIIEAIEGASVSEPDAELVSA